MYVMNKILNMVMPLIDHNHVISWEAQADAHVTRLPWKRFLLFSLSLSVPDAYMCVPTHKQSHMGPVSCLKPDLTPYTHKEGACERTDHRHKLKSA